MTTGKELEALVKEIESHVLGDGFQVTERQRVYDDSGTQIAEFDLVITGKVGTSSINWLIECRDRPSDGPAPASWIQELDSRKRYFHFDKVFAVSTTGFTRGAEKLANDMDIVLRTVEAIADLGSEFAVRGVALTLREFEFLGSGDLLTADPFDGREVAGIMPRVKPPESSEYQDLTDVLLEKLPRRPQEPEVERLLFVHQGWLDMQWGDKYIRACDVRVPIEIRTRVVEGKMLVAKAYLEEDRLLGQHHEFELALPDGVVKVEVLVVKNPDGTKAHRFSVPPLPGGIRVTEVVQLTPDGRMWRGRVP